MPDIGKDFFEVLVGFVIESTDELWDGGAGYWHRVPGYLVGGVKPLAMKDVQFRRKLVGSQEPYWSVPSGYALLKGDMVRPGGSEKWELVSRGDQGRPADPYNGYIRPSPSFYRYVEFPGSTSNKASNGVTSASPPSLDPEDILAQALRDFLDTVKEATDERTARFIIELQEFADVLTAAAQAPSIKSKKPW